MLLSIKTAEVTCSLCTGHPLHIQIMPNCRCNLHGYITRFYSLSVALEQSASGRPCSHQATMPCGFTSCLYTTLTMLQFPFSIQFSPYSLHHLFSILGIVCLLNSNKYSRGRWPFATPHGSLTVSKDIYPFYLGSVYVHA